MRKYKKRKIWFSILFCLIIIYWWILPKTLFEKPISTILTSKSGELLGASIAVDGQWRFPHNEYVPDKFRKAILTFEDKRFGYHWGFDALAFGRAIGQNISAGEIVSGGSTITMQVIRLSRNKSRTVLEKMVEIVLATRFEFSYSKDEILALYASNAPFGGNVVGLDAASWRYFGRSPDKLSWAENALLAVLPNNPALIHPGRNRKRLLNKRNRLLKQLFDEKIIDNETYELSLDEPIPEKPQPFPQYAPHLLARIKKELSVKQRQAKLRTTIDVELQKKVSRLIAMHNKILSAKQIHNLAVLVLDVKSGNAIVYAGNTHHKHKIHQNDVDIIVAPRSTGSILKPFLYAAMLTEGSILPNALVPDIPIQLGGYSPQNYNRGYDGAVPAKNALARSLNIPIVKMLQKYGVPKFHHLLQKIGLTTINKPPDHYGLSIILGGCEGTLWDICGAYASMARTLNNYSILGGKYSNTDYHEARYMKTDKKPPQIEDASSLSAGAIYLMFKALLKVERPDSESNWEFFSSSKKISWKTGTSFGFRDAWSVGITPKYVVGVWVGNADGEGRPDLVGIRAAAPVLFDVFDILPDESKWFEKPYDDLLPTKTCRQSGFLMSLNCPDTVMVDAPNNAQRFDVCPYHKVVHLDATESWQVHSDCESSANMRHKKWFVLPAAIEWFYKNKHSDYHALPPFRNDCMKNIGRRTKSMQLIYPQIYSKILIPKDLDEKSSDVIFEVAHRTREVSIYWHIDDKYIATTQIFHQLAIAPHIGKHNLTLIDENGEVLSLEFEIVGSE